MLPHLLPQTPHWEDGIHLDGPQTYLLCGWCLLSIPPQPYCAHTRTNTSVRADVVTSVEGETNLWENCSICSKTRATHWKLTTVSCMWRLCKISPLFCRHIPARRQYRVSTKGQVIHCRLRTHLILMQEYLCEPNENELTKSCKIWANCSIQDINMNFIRLPGCA